MLINVVAMDQHLLEELKNHLVWTVHSRYKNSFNLQNVNTKELAVVTTTDYSRLPNGIYLEKKAFLNLINTIGIGTAFIWQKDRLACAENQLIVTHAEMYSSEMNDLGQLKEATLHPLFCYCKNLEKETGFQLSLGQFIQTKNLFARAIHQLSANKIVEQSHGVRFLLGRGPGLTPTGDDILIGYLAANILLNKSSENVIMILDELLAAAEAPTTTVSNHYLLCGMTGRFSQSVRELVNVLTKASSREQIELKIRAVTSFGHTSGIDLLAGFLGTIAYYKENEGGVLWQIV